MSDTHQATGSEPSSGTTSTTGTSSPAGGAPGGTNGGAPPQPFYESFANKALAADERLHRFAGAEQLAQSYIDLEKRFGIKPERRIDLPEDMANEEEMRSAVWSKLGLPEKPDGYNFKLGENATAEDNAMLGKYVAQAHKVGLPTAQARQMLEWWVAENAAAQTTAAEQLAQRRTDGEAALKSAFGNAYEDRMREAKNLVARYDPEGKTGLSAENLTTFPAWTQMLIRMSDRMQEPEGGLPPGETQVSDRPLTPAQAQAALSAFGLDGAKQTALFDDKHPSHKAVIEERRRLLEAANPRPAGPVR